MIPEKDLENYTRSHTRIVDDGFVIDIRKHVVLDQLLKQIGIKKGYRIMADCVCLMYEEKYKEPFLFSNACVAYEIEYHVDAYMCAMGYRGYIRNVTTYLLSKKILIRACEDINISVNDTFNLQSVMFQYYRGIRSCFKNTDKDPYKKYRISIRKKNRE